MNVGKMKNEYQENVSKSPSQCMRIAVLQFGKRNKVELNIITHLHIRTKRKEIR